MRLHLLVSVLQKRARMIVVTAAAVALVAVSVSAIMPPSYQGQATVLLIQQNAGTVLLGSPQAYQTDLALQRDVHTQVMVMRSSVILKPVIESLKLNTDAKELASRVTVGFDGQTDIVTVEVRDSTPERAANVANKIAATYVGWSQERQRASIRAAAVDVAKRLKKAQEQIVAVQGAISAGDNSGARRVQLDAANRLYATLSDQLEQLNINEQLSTGSGSVLSTASPDPVPVSPKPVRNGALGLAVGLVLGLGIAFVADALDTTIKTVEECEELFEAPVLCTIPEDKSGGRGNPTLTLVNDPGGPVAEAYRVLRNNLGFVNFEHGMKAVLVTSSMPNEGKSTVAANLAAVLARAGKSVVLLDCDFHQPGSAQFFDVNHRFGLSDVLRGELSIEEAMQRPEDFDSLWIVPAGGRPPNPSELLGSTSMQSLVNSLRETYDWVVLDSAPLLVVADAAAAAPWVDGVLVAAQVNASTRDAARKCREQLRKVGARILGVALWGLEDTTNRGGYSAYGSRSAGK